MLDLSTSRDFDVVSLNTMTSPTGDLNSTIIRHDCAFEFPDTILGRGVASEL